MTRSDKSIPGDDPFDLNRFISAQQRSYDSALAELRNGQKRSHWMWFIFPQIVGLGRSSTAQHYAIKSLEEARQYLNHPLLGPRLLECSEAVAAVEGRSVAAIFGYPDDLKLRSSMTLFAPVVEDPHSIFNQILDKYFQGEPDVQTLQILENLG